MTMDKLVSRYIDNAEHVFKSMRISPERIPRITEDKIEEIIEYAKHYLSDARHYRDRQQLETGLTAIAYCEGLLDALRLLGVAEFSWPTE